MTRQEIANRFFISTGQEPTELNQLLFDLRGSLRGQSDPWPDTVLKSVLEYITSYLENWTDPSDEMDLMVKRMIEIFIESIQKELKERAEYDANKISMCCVI